MHRLARPLLRANASGASRGLASSLKTPARLGASRNLLSPPTKFAIPPRKYSNEAAPPVKHVDSMPRFPQPSIPGALRLSDYIGTASFASSGCVTAGTVANMDLLGCVLVGTITAIGGGTVRDLLIGQTPFWSSGESEYIWISLVTATATFFFWKTSGLEEDNVVLVWGDTLGVGAFAVIGTMNGIKKKLPALLCMGCGMMTATFGGMIRDVLAQRKPRILHSYAELYATTALMGSAAYLTARALAMPLPVRIVSGVATSMVARWAAWTYDLKLPVWSSVNGVDKA